MGPRSFVSNLRRASHQPRRSRGHSHVRLGTHHGQAVHHRLAESFSFSPYVEHISASPSQDILGRLVRTTGSSASSFFVRFVVSVPSTFKRFVPVPHAPVPTPSTPLGPRFLSPPSSQRKPIPSGPLPTSPFAAHVPPPSHRSPLVRPSSFVPLLLPRRSTNGPRGPSSPFPHQKGGVPDGLFLPLGCPRGHAGDDGHTFG